MKFDWESIKDWALLHKVKLIAIALAAVLVFAAILWALDAFDSWSFNRSHTKAKEQVANTAKEIANIQTEITNLETKKAEKVGELKRDTEALTNSLFGLDEAKKETNAALANLQKAVNANTNVDRSVQDLEKVLEKLQ